MKVDLNLLGKNKRYPLFLYEAQLESADIDELELLDVLIFPVELVYSVKHIVTIVHLALDNLDADVQSLEFKIAVKNLFYNRKKPFRSYYSKYIVVFLGKDDNFKGKKGWDAALKSLKGMVYCDIEQVKRTYGISEKQLELSINLDDHICTSINQQALKSL